MYSLLGNPSVKHQEPDTRSKKYGIIFVIAIFVLIYYLFGLTDTVFKKQVVRNPVVSNYSDNSWGNDNLYYQKQANLNEQKFKQRTITKKPATNPPRPQNAVFLTKDVLSDPMVRKIVPYTLGRNDIRYVEWENSCVLPPNITEEYNHFSKLVCSGSNAIDIGAQAGDTTVGIAAATHGGVTYAYEPHPKAFHILHLQQKLNPILRLKSFNIALMKDLNNEMWWNGVGDGCNGGIQTTSCGGTSKECIKIKSEDVATNFENLPIEFVKQLSFIKIDTEGNDRYVLRGLKDSILEVIRPLIKIEWYAFFKKCSSNANDMFRAIEEIDYIPYGINYGIAVEDLKLATCDNYFPDLILVPREWNTKEKGIKICPEVVHRK
jgi:FkbM family methyltransferase